MKKILTIFVFLIFFPKNSYAYLDPGTGSFILQSILAFIAAVGAGISIYWEKFKSFFKKKNKNFKETNLD